MDLEELADHHCIIQKKKDELNVVKREYRNFLKIELFYDILEVLKKYNKYKVGIVFPDEYLLNIDERELMTTIINSLLKSGKYFDPDNCFNREQKDEKEFHYAEEWKANISFYDCHHYTDALTFKWKYEPAKEFILESYPDSIKKPEIFLYYISNEINDEGTDLPMITNDKDEYISSMAYKFEPPTIDKSKVERTDFESPISYEDDFMHYPTLILSSNK